MRYSILVGVLALATLSNNAYSITQDDQEIILSGMKHTKDSFVLPNSNSIVSSVKGHQVIILDNKRFAVKGELYDMWTQQPIKSLVDAQRAETFLPVKKLGIDFDSMLSYPAFEDPDYHVFLDPTDRHATKNLEQIYKQLSDKKIRITFTVLFDDLSEDKKNNFFGFSCQLSELNINNGKIELPKSVNAVTNPCDQRVFQTAGMTQFLNLKKLPVVVNASTSKIESINFY